MLASLVLFADVFLNFIYRLLLGILFVCHHALPSDIIHQYSISLSACPSPTTDPIPLNQIFTSIAISIAIAMTLRL